MSASQLVVAISLLAVTIAEDKTVDEISELAAIFVQLGDTLSTIATHKPAES